MSGFELFLFIVLLALCLLAKWGTEAAYKNGVTDGYGYSREPRNPGYREAGKYLYEGMRHRWRDIPDPNPAARFRLVTPEEWERRLKEEPPEDWVDDTAADKSN